MRGIGVFLALSVFSSAEENPSVWDQMKEKSQKKTISKIEKVSLAGDQVLVEFREVDGNSVVLSQAKLCGEMNEALPTSRSEAIKAMFQKQRIEELQQAQRQGDLMELSFDGPWNPCVSNWSKAVSDSD